MTKSDEVYAFGVNIAGCLGLGDVHSTLTPQKVLALSKKGIIGIEISSISIITLFINYQLWGFHHLF